MALYPWFSSTPNHKIAYDQSYLMACLTWPPPLNTWGFTQSWNKIDDKHIPASIVSPVTKPQLSFGIDAILSDKVGSPRKESVPDLWSTSTKAQHLYEEKNETSNKQQQQSRRKRSWSRAVFSNLQRKGLEKRFQIQKYITKPDRRQLAATLGLTDAQVKVWFQNRRMKWRHSKEKDPEGSTIKSENCVQTAEGSQLTQLNEDN